MTPITEGLLRFEFPNNWIASKFDEWSFYRNQFIRIGNALSKCGACNNQQDAGVKAIDILAIGPDSVCWQIEIKDYRLTNKSDLLFLADEVAIKVRDTLACLAAARLNANVSDEKHAAQKALRCKQIKVVLHLEKPLPASSIEPTKSRKVNLVDRLKRLLKSVDPHPKVVDANDMAGLGWTVTNVAKK